MNDYIKRTICCNAVYVLYKIKNHSLLLKLIITLLKVLRMSHNNRSRDATFHSKSLKNRSIETK